jgi:hypothetical protein
MIQGIAKLSVLMPSVVIILSAVMLSVDMPDAIILSAAIASVTILSVEC